MGPDEFHDGYPDAATPGLNNNAYTNIMAVWVLCRALEVLDLLSDVRRAELMTRLDLSADEIARWDDISRRMYVPFHDDGIISQFEGYEKLRELDWDDLPDALRQYSAPRSDPRGGKRQRQPLQTVEASRRADVVLSVFRRRAWRVVWAPWLSAWTTKRSRETSPTMIAALPTVPLFHGSSIRGSWRGRIGRARCATLPKRCRAM